MPCSIPPRCNPPFIRRRSIDPPQVHTGRGCIRCGFIPLTSIDPVPETYARRGARAPGTPLARGGGEIAPHEI